MKKGDFAAVFIILFAAAAIFFVGAGRSGGQLTAVVTQDGKVLKQVIISGLEQPVDILVHGSFENKITCGDGYAQFTDATCPNKTCVSFGRLTRAGQVAVCAENHVILEIKGVDAFDAVVK